jgi:hypothetical protein
VSLYTQLQAAKSEDNVKDAYIKAQGLKGYTKGLIDIQSREIWFEAKDTDRHSSYANRPDEGWYQIRNALAERNKSGDTAPVNFTPFESAYESLTDKLRPQVFSLGFLR